MRAVPAPQAAELLARGEAIVVDVRGEDEWAAGHVGGAVHVPLDLLPLRVEELPLDTTILAVCRSGRRSALAVDALLRAGRTAANLAGGMEAWARAGLPLEPAEGEVI